MSGYHEERPPHGVERLGDQPEQPEMPTDKFETLRLMIEDVNREMSRIKRSSEDSDVRKASADSQLQRLLDLQEREARERKEKEASEAAQEISREEHRRKVTNRVLGIMSAVVVVAGGGTVTYTQLTPEAPANPTTTEVVESVEKNADRAAEQVGGQVEDLEHKIETLEDVATDQQIELEATQVQLVEGIEYIGKKIDKAHPSRAGDVPEPPSFKAAKKKARRDEVRRRLLEEGDLE